MTDHMADMLRAGAGTVAASKLVADLGPGVAALADGSSGLLAAEARAQSARMLARFAGAGVPQAEAAMVTRLFDLDGSVGLARLAGETGVNPQALTHGFTDLGARLGLDWAQMTAARMSPSDPWERLLINGLARDFQQMRLDFLRRAMSASESPATAVARWADEHALAVAQFRKVVARAQAAAPVAPAMLAQIASQARNLLGR